MQDTEKKFYPLKGYEEFYEINKLGEVRRKARWVSQWNGAKYLIPEKKLKTTTPMNGNRYPAVLLRISSDKILKRHNIHRLLAIQFIPNPNNYPIINHIDGSRDNNLLENIEWCTYSQNTIHRFEVMNHVSENRSLKNEDVIFIYENGTYIDNKTKKRCLDGFSVDELSIKFNISKQVIYTILNGKFYKNVTKNLKRKGETNND